MSDREESVQDFSGLIPGSERPRGRRQRRGERQGERQGKRENERQDRSQDQPAGSARSAAEPGTQPSDSSREASSTEPPVGLATEPAAEPADSGERESGAEDTPRAAQGAPEAPEDKPAGEEASRPRESGAEGAGEAGVETDQPLARSYVEDRAAGEATPDKTFEKTPAKTSTRAPKSRKKSQGSPSASLAAPSLPEYLAAADSLRPLPPGETTPMAVRDEPVIPSHYTLPESHTIVVDEIRAVLRRPPYRYTKRQASQSNVVALAIERLYEDITGEPMPRYGSEL